jgi:hypothetical protein
MASGGYDANGIWIYGEDDPASPVSDLLNLLAESTSGAVEDEVARLAALETLTTDVGWNTKALAGTGDLSSTSTETIVSGCHLSLAIGTWDIVAKGQCEWSTAGGNYPTWTIRLRTGGVAGTQRDTATVGTGSHLGYQTVMLMKRVVVAAPTTVDMTVIVTGPASGSTIFANANITATPAHPA